MNFRKTWIVVTAIAGLVAPAVLHAQSTIHPSFFGSTEFDTKGTNFYLLGTYIGFPTGGAWSPYFEADAYHLNFPAGAKRQSLNAVNPTIGLQHNAARASVSFGVGYSFVSSNASGASLNTERGGESGVTASFGANSTGPGERPYQTEFLANYNFGSSYLWSRARGSVPAGTSAAHPLRVGLELVGQGGSHNGSSTHAFSVGPFFNYQVTPQFKTGLAGGAKFYGSNGTTGSGTAAYIKWEFSLSPFK
jgi:hypothetical protein